MLQQLFGVRHVLHHMSVEGNGKSLYAAANAKHRNLPVVGEACEQKFWQIALTVYIMQTGQWLITIPQWVEVASSCQQHSIHGVESGEYCRDVSYRRYEQRCASGTQYLAVVGRAYRGVNALIVGGYANDGTVVGYGGRGVELVEMAFEVECFHIHIILKAKLKIIY